VVLCELAEGGGEPGVVGSRSDEPQTEDGIVRHLGVSIVRELAAIHKSCVSDLDSIRQWIRFRIRIQKGKKDPQKLKKIKTFHVLKCWMFSFEG
jgi:hypothetical protein